MAASIKNNLIHEVVGVLASGKQYEYEPEEIILHLILSKWHRTWFIKWYKKKYSIHQINYSCKTLENDGKELMQDSRGRWHIIGPAVLSELRESYAIGEYKEVKKWWVWPARILSALVGIATIVGVADSIQSPALRRKIEGKQRLIDSLVERTISDSLNPRLNSGLNRNFRKVKKRLI